MFITVKCFLLKRHTLGYNVSVDDKIVAYFQHELRGCMKMKEVILDNTKASQYFSGPISLQVAEVFPDDYVHLGGDEVDFGCWLSNDEIRKWLDHRTSTYKNGTTLHTYFLTRMVKIVEKLKKRYIVWQEVFDDGVKMNKETIVNVWKGSWKREMNKVTKAGHLAILSSCWYLNYLKYALDWPKHYKCDPHKFKGSPEQKKLVIGGSAAMWGEYVDATNVIQYSFGRGFAVAERLWSSADVNEVRLALPRIWEHRCRYISRGIPAEPVTTGTFCRKEWKKPH